MKRQLMVCTRLPSSTQKSPVKETSKLFLTCSTVKRYFLLTLIQNFQNSRPTSQASYKRGYNLCIMMLMYMQHSWKWFIYTRCQNVNCRSASDSLTTTNKRGRPKTSGRKVIHPVSIPEVSKQRNIDLLKKEINKLKPSTVLTSTLHLIYMYKLALSLKRLF